MSDERPERCDRCRFWKRIDQEGEGVCRRLPPTPVLTVNSPDYQLGEGMWPWTSRDDWCGEFRPKDADV